ncbi:MAG TPA: hypothetical protein ENN28_01085 [Candidatus Uhrbacteria bacterium]|nr:hypothetical protein [Candidatus Uhrbacteria bacterium]
MAKKIKNGFSVIEILLVVFIFLIIFVGFSYLLADNVQSSFDNQERIKAEFLVQEGLEAVKAIGANNWQALAPGQYGLILADNKWQLAAEPENIEQFLKQGYRLITIEEIDDNLRQIKSEVVWQSLVNKNKISSALTYLSSWQHFVAQCSDGIDNDGDGLIDYPDDPGCESALDNNEAGAGLPPDPDDEYICDSLADCGIVFTDYDLPLCVYEPKIITVNGQVILPEEIQADLLLSYYIVYPEDKRTVIEYFNQGLVDNAAEFSLAVFWPGIRPADQKVEIHIGGRLLDPKTSRPLMSRETSLVYYWQPWVCLPPDNYAEDSDNGFDIIVIENESEVDELIVVVKNNNSKALSHVAISLPVGVAALSPQDKSTYLGNHNLFKVENPTNKPFYAIKFETIGEGIKNGESEVFKITLPAGSLADGQPIIVQAKGGTIEGQVIIDFQ